MDWWLIQRTSSLIESPPPTNSVILITIQYVAIKFKVKNANGIAVTLQSAVGKSQRTDELSLVLNVRRHCEDVTSDGRLFQVLAAATGNARSPIVESRVSGSPSNSIWPYLSSDFVSSEREYC